MVMGLLSLLDSVGLALALELASEIGGVGVGGVGACGGLFDHA